MNNEQPRCARRLSWRARTNAGVIVLLVAGGAWYLWGRPAARAERLLAQARVLRSAGNCSQAENIAASAIELDPTLGPAALLAAECAASTREFARAIGYLRCARPGDSRLRLHVELFAANLNQNQLHHLSDAESSYRRVLEAAPDHREANAGLAKLLALCGRTREAVPHILRLVRLGEATDQLVLLGRVDAVVDDLAALEMAHRAAPDDANPLIGLAWHAGSAEQTDQAIALLQQAIARQPRLVAAHVALGQQFFAARRFDALGRWERQLPTAAADFPETWAVRGRMAENAGDSRGAIRCYWEAVRRAPEMRAANFRLARLLANIGATGPSTRFAEQARRTRELESLQDRALFSSGQNEIEPLVELAKGYESAGRLWEAYGWCRMAAQADGTHQAAGRYLGSLRRKVERIPLQLTVDAANPALEFDLSAYPLPNSTEASSELDSARHDGPATISFRDDAAATGLRFRYCNGADGSSQRKMFEFTGGGIGVLDFDLDGCPDIFFTQGRPWPPDLSSGEYGGRLFWNRGGIQFKDVTGQCGIQDGGFGQGIAVGDVDADGFPDLYAAHIGANQLWRNHGDGTFADATRQAGVAGGEHQWTTSCLLADLNGDSLADIYAATYVTGADVFERVCQHPDGSPKICMPFDFEAQPDRLWLNDGNGHFTQAPPGAVTVGESGKGLGLAAWDARGSGRLSLLVANDTTPNFFFTPEPAGDGRPLLRDRGIEAGLAVSGEGKAKGCMGIALADVDRDGQLDVHITNFLGESSTFYMSQPAGDYEDRTRETGLISSTIDILGFGTQFLDADLDGQYELFLANGHIDDFRRFGKPYKMQPKLFHWEGRRFVELDPAGLGPYFEDRWLGRSVVRLDWNRDGREDLVVGHLDEEAALLTNTTPAAGRYLSMKFFGVESNRDAIGTMVQARVGQQRFVGQITAGDGYQASNERRLVFGVGNAVQIDELAIHWPSGALQTFIDVPTDQEVWIREGGPLMTARRPRD